MSEVSDYRIMRYHIIDPTVYSYTGPKFRVYASEEFTQDGKLYAREQQIAEFIMLSDAHDYVDAKNKSLDLINSKWLEERAIIKLKALELRVSADIQDIEHPGNVPSKQIKKCIAAAEHYLSVSGGQKFEP